MHILIQLTNLKCYYKKLVLHAPGGEPAATQMHYADPIEHDHAEEPMQVVSVDVDDEQEEPVNPYNSGTPDKQVLTNIIRDKLKAYLMNGSK